MRKIYYCLLLLLMSPATYAQNPLLTPFFTVPDSTDILDYRYNKVFVSKQRDSIYHIIDVSSGNATLMPIHRALGRSGYLPYPYVRVTPYGAIFTVHSNTGVIYPTYRHERVTAYEWHNGALSVLDSAAFDVQTAGDYAIWFEHDTASGFTLMLKNLATRQETVVDSSVWDAAVAENGMVAYTRAQAMYSYFNGVKTLIADTNTAYAGYYYPRTDGQNITYMVGGEGITTWLMLYDGASSTPLMDLNTVVDNSEYYVGNAAPSMNNGHMAGVRPIYPYRPGDEYRLWSRSSQGALRDLAIVKPHTSPFGAASVGALDAAGNMAVYARAGDTSGIWYVSQDGSLMKRIYDDSYVFYNRGGGVYYENNNWIIGSNSEHVLYKVNLDTVYDHHILPFEKITLPQTRLRFTNNDFIQHYTGPDTGRGQLLKVCITERPRHGTLIARDNRPIFSNNVLIDRADLDSLQYSPYGGFTGRDTAVWRAYDGLSWTNDTMIIFQVSPAPPMDSIQPFDKNTLAGTPIHFRADDFVQQYSGQLQRISITALPPYGKLTVGGKAVFYERSRELTLAEMDSLVYTPKTGIVGVDTFQWKAFNGNSWTNYDTATVLHIYPALDAAPAIRTLQPLYLSNAAPASIWIVNYPPDRWHTEVTVQVDDAVQLPVTANHTFILDPAAYAPGAHSLCVTFAHPLDTISLSRYFAIVPWPLFQLNALGKYFSAALEQGQEKLSTWPNPFDQQFTLSGLQPSSTYILELYDQQGKPVMSRRVTGSSREVITAGGIPGKGIYLLRIYDESRKRVAGTFKLLHL